MLFNFIKKKIKEMNVYSQVVRELSSMSDRDLRDIGIRRGDIHEIAAAAVKEKGENQE